MFFGNCWESAFYLSLTSEKNPLSAAPSGELCQWELVDLWKGREAVLNVFLHQNSVSLIPTLWSLHCQPCVMRNDYWGVCGLMCVREQSCILSWSSQMSLLEKDEEVRKSCSLKRIEPRWLQNALGATCKMGAFLLVSSREMWCSGASLHLLSPSYAHGSRQQHSGRCFFWAIWASLRSGKTGFAARAKGLQPRGGAGGGAEPGDTWELDFLLLFLCSHPPSAAPAQAKPTAEPWTSCSPLWVQPPTWLVPGAGLGHSQCCFKPIYSHFRGESSLKSFGTFLQGFAFQRPWFQPSTCPFLFLQHFIDFFFTTQKPYLSKCVKHPKTGMLYSTDLNFEMYQHSLTSSLLIKDLSEHSQQGNIK